MTIGIIVAMELELKQMLRFIPQMEKTHHGDITFWSGSLGSDVVVVTKCGIGKVNAAYGAVTLIEGFHPDVVISTGCAGGATTALEVRDVVVSSRTCFHDVWCGSPNAYGQVQDMPAYYECDSDCVRIASSLSGGHKVHAGLIVTGDWFVDTVEKMRSIAETFPDALAVDMETAAIAQVCYRLKQRFLSFRVISDIPMKPNNAIAFQNFWNDVADQSFGLTRELIFSILSKK